MANPIKRPYSYSQYWTGTSLQWRLMRGNMLKIICIFPHQPPLKVTSSPILRIRIWSIFHFFFQHPPNSHYIVDKVKIISKRKKQRKKKIYWKQIGCLSHHRTVIAISCKKLNHRVFSCLQYLSQEIKIRGHLSSLKCQSSVIESVITTTKSIKE